MNETEKKELFSLSGMDFSTVNTMDYSDIKAPKIMSLTDKLRNYRITQKDFELNQKLLETPEPTIGQRIGAGISDSLVSLMLVPEETANIRRRLFSGYEFPNATKEQALAVADASSNVIRNIRDLRAQEQLRQGIKPDDWVKNLSSGVTTVGAYSLLSYATGGIGLAVAGFQEAGEASQEWYEDYSKENKGVDLYNRTEDSLAAVGHGVVSGLIERGLGVERLFSPLIARKVFAKTGTQRALRAGVIGSLGEAGEEALQDVSKYAFGHMTGADTRSLDELLQEMANDAIYAAVIGGGFGSGAYHIQRSRMISTMSDMGMTQNEATQATDEILDEGTQYILNDFIVRDQIQKGYGQEFNNLVTKIKDVITATGRTDLAGENLDKYAKLNAVNFVMPAIHIANLQRIPVNEVLNLSEIIVEGNALHIQMPNINDPVKLEKEIKAKKAELKALNSQIAIDNKDRKKSLRLKIKLLENRLKTLTGNEEIYNARTTAKKAQRDQRVIAETKPEIVADLKGIRNANNENFVYVGETKLPVQYEVRSLDEIQPSHINGEPNPNYTLKELQNRTRGTMVDEAILQNRAANLKPEELGQSPNTQYGAPLVNHKNEVISGNGRLETLRKAYELGNTSYKEMLDKLGFDTNGIERPVLVRKTVDDLTPEQQVAVAEASNVSQTSAFDHARQAMNDAKKLGKKVIDVVTFADNLPVTERQAYIKEDGTYDMLALQRRFDDAVMAYIIGDTKTFDALVLSNKLPHKAMEGLSRQGAAIVEFDRSYPEMGLKEDLRSALVKLAAMRNRGEYISVIQQRDIEDGMTFSSDALLYGMTFSNNSSQVNNFMDYYIQRHKNYLEGEKENLLADTLPKFSKEDITSQILRNSPLTADKFDKEGVTTDANLKALFLNKIPASDELYNTTMPLMLEQNNIFYQTGIENRPEYRKIQDLKNELDTWNERLEIDKKNPYNLNQTAVEHNIQFDKKEISKLKKQIKELEKSLNEPISDKLYATHNMSLAGVRDALKLGGLAMPSLALRKVSQGNINQFGDIVFVANERLATPSKNIEVYDRDAWTPNLSYAIKYDLKPEANTFVKKVLEKHGRERELSTFVYNIIENLDTPKSNTMAMDLYDLDTGHKKAYGVNEYINNTNYLDWYDEHFTSMTDPYLWTENASNTDMVRKKFTLDNMMKILKKQERSGGGYIGDYIFDVYKLLNFRSQKFKNLKEIKKNREKLVSREEAQKGLDKLNEEFLALAEDLKKEGENYSFGDATYGLGLAVVQDSDEQMAYWLKDRNLQSDEKAIKKVKDFIEKMKNIPTDYFEAKPRRVVDFSEFSGVIIPEGKQYDEVANILQKQHYLNVERVEKGNEDQYEKALNNIQSNASTTFFQLSPQEEENFTEMFISQGKKGVLNWINSQIEFYRNAVDDAIDEEGRKYFRSIRDKKIAWLREVEDFINTLEDKGTSLTKAVERTTDKSIEEKAKKHFGTTYNTNEAGYILTDGSMLDFSGKREGGRAGTRSYDHREISSAFENADIGMEEFVNNGAIRYMPESDSLFIANIPTQQQMNIINKILTKANGQINIELVTDAQFMGREDKSFYKEFDGNATIKNVKNAIDAFYSGNLSKLQDFYTQRSQANGFFDAELKTVVLGSNFNYGTLPHEFAHFWLDKMFTMWKSGEATPEFNEMFQGLADVLGITKEQSELTRNQQEQYATMTEGYLFNKAAFPDGAKPAMNLFFEWCPEQYQSLLDIGYRDEEGNIHNPIFTDEALKWFDDFYANMVGLNNSHISLMFDNPDDQNGEKMTSPETTIANRERLIDEEHPDSLDVMKNQPQAVKEAFVESQDKEIPLVKEAYEEAITREETREKTIPEKIKQYVKIGRGTNTREGMDKAAQEYIKNNPERAEQIAFGSPIAGGVEGFEGWTTGDPYVENDSGIDRAVLIINVMAKYGEDTPQYAALYHNLALTRSYAGKTGGLTNDISQQFYLKGYAEINRALESKAALARYGKGSNSVDLWNRDIDRFIQDNVDAIFSTEPESAERDKALNKFFEKASKVLGADNPDQFLQESLNRARKMTKKDRQQFIEFARREIKKKAGGEMSAQDISKLMNLSIEAQKAAIDIDSNDINKAKSASIAIRSWQDFVNSKGVQKSFLDKLIGEWMPRAMLSGISTHVVNNVSNFVNDTFVKAATIFHFGNNVVSTQVINREQERLWAIYNATGQNLAESIRVDQVSKLHAENYQLPQATTLLQKIDPFRLLGKEDFYFRSKRYLDTLARIASKDAKGDVKEANRLFNEYKKMNSTDERAIEARMQAITVGNIAVFTCDGQLAKMISNIRRELDRINLVDFGEKGHYGLGTLIAPFAKVPTNIIGMGLEALASPFKSLAYLAKVKKNWTIQDTIALETFAGSLATVLVYIAGACDYQPPYEPPEKYDPEKPYDSIKIGKVWIGLDTFGAFSTSLRFALTMVNGHKQGFTNEKALSKSLKTVLGQLPLIDANTDYAIQHPFKWLESESYNQINKAVPALIKPVIRAADREAGLDMDWWNPEVLPQWRRKFARNYGFDSQKTSINDWIHFIYGKAWVDRK